jgi:hypothetical protein
MKKSTWTPVIAVEDPETHALRTVRTVREARDLLRHRWPAHEGSRYELAGAACDKALKGEADASDARKAFIAAAIEAHLHIG